MVGGRCQSGPEGAAIDEGLLPGPRIYPSGAMSTRAALVKQRRVDAKGLQTDHSYKRLDEFMKL
jgi:hypothetical protein